MLITHRLWQRSFGANPDIVGSPTRVGAQSFIIIGVAPPGFRGIMTMFPADVWVPFAMIDLLLPVATQAAGDNMRGDREIRWLFPIARLLRLARSLLIEGLSLAFLSGTVALLLASAGHRLLPRLILYFPAPTDQLDAGPDYRVVIFTAVICSVAAAGLFARSLRSVSRKSKVRDEGTSGRGGAPARVTSVPSLGP